MGDVPASFAFPPLHRIPKLRSCDDSRAGDGSDAAACLYLFRCLLPTEKVQAETSNAKYGICSQVPQQGRENTERVPARSADNHYPMHRHDAPPG